MTQHEKHDEDEDDDDNLILEQDDYVPVYHPPLGARETLPELPRKVTRMGRWSWGSQG